jgi:hypothetical protein
MLFRIMDADNECQAGIFQYRLFMAVSLKIMIETMVAEAPKKDEPAGGGMGGMDFRSAAAQRSCFTKAPPLAGLFFVFAHTTAVDASMTPGCLRDFCDRVSQFGGSVSRK